MKKRILSMLFVIVLLVAACVVTAQAENPGQAIIDAAAALPQFPYTEADATPVSQKAVCPVCGSNQTFVALSTITTSSNLGGGGTKHYYVDKAVLESTLVYRNLGGTAHMYLNNATLKSSTADYVLGSGGYMSVFGNGNVINTGTGVALKAGGTRIDVYGGTYSATSNHTIQTWNTTTPLNIYGGTFNAVEGKYALYLNGGVQNVYGGEFDNMIISADNAFSKDYIINIKGDVTGAVTVQKGILNVDAGASIDTINMTKAAGTVNLSGEATTVNATAGALNVTGGEIETATVTGATVAISSAATIDALDLTAATTLPITVSELAEGADITVLAATGTNIAEGLTAADAAYFTFGGTDPLYETTVDENGNLVIAQKTFDTPAKVKAFADAMTFPTGSDVGNATAYCPVCNANVTWKPLKNGISRLLGNYGARAKQHYYVAETINATSQGSGFLTDGSESHIHLNGQTVSLTNGSTCFTATSATNNNASVLTSRDIILMGNGNIAAVGSGYAINTNSGTVTVYGGTITAEATHAVQVLYGAFNAYGGTIYGASRSVFMNNGTTMNIDGANLTKRVVADSAGGKDNTINVYSGSVAGIGMLRGTLTITGGSVIGDSSVQNAAKLVVGGNAIVGSADMPVNLLNGASIEVMSNFAGTAYVDDFPASGYNKAVPGSACAADFTGTLYVETYKAFWDGETGLKTGTATVVDGTTEILYKNAADAIAAAEGKLVKLYAAEDIVLAGNAAIDVNGFDITISGEGTVALADSVNKAKVNEATAVYGIVTLDGVTAIGAENYIVLTEGNTASAHYYEQNLASVALKAPEAGDNVGLYYKGAWTMDSVLKNAAKVGVVVSLTKMPTASFYSEYEEAVANGTKHENFFFDYNGNTIVNGEAKTSVLVSGILKTSRSSAENDTAGQKKIYAAAYIQIPQQGTVVVSNSREDGNDQLSAYDVLAKIQNKGETPLDAFFTKWNQYSNAETEVAILNGLFVPTLRFAVTSDTHVRANGAYQSYERLQQFVSTAYDYTDAQDLYNKLDGMFIVGDYTNGGAADDQNYVFNYLNENTREETVTRAILGNHEFYAAGGYNADSYAQTPIDYMAYSGYESSNSHQVVNGVHFIFVNMDFVNKGGRKYFSDATIAWLKEQLDIAVADDPTKPIFVFQHEPPADTMVGSYGSGADINLRNLFNDYPQVVNFSGHTHANITDPRAIWQGEFTAINTGGLAYLSISDPSDATYQNGGYRAMDMEGGYWKNGMDGLSDMETSYRNAVFYYIVEMDRNGIVQVKKCNVLTGEIEGEVYTIDVNDPENFQYTDARKDAAEAPVFAEDAQVVALSKNAVKAIVKFPQATSEDVVQGYRVELYKGEELISSQYRVSNTSYGSLAPEFVKAYFDDLEVSTDYTAKVYAISSFAKLSEPLVLNFTTNAQSVTPIADILNVTFNTDNTAKDTNTNEQLSVWGAPTVSFDETVGMNVASFNGSTDAFADYSIRNWYGNFSEGFTLEAYVYVGAKPNLDKHQAILSNQQSGGIALVYRDDGTLRLSIFSNKSGASGWKYVGTPSKVTANSWYHIVGTFDGTDMLFYLNGELVGQTLDVGPLKNVRMDSNLAQFMAIGSDSGVGKIDYPFKGKVAIARAYTEVLTADQIATLYNDVVS